MLTAGAGRLVSSFANDPFALVALAFKNLYPEREYACLLYTSDAADE